MENQQALVATEPHNALRIAFSNSSTFLASNSTLQFYCLSHHPSNSPCPRLLESILSKGRLRFRLFIFVHRLMRKGKTKLHPGFPAKPSISCKLPAPIGSDGKTGFVFQSLRDLLASSSRSFPKPLALGLPPQAGASRPVLSCR